MKTILIRSAQAALIAATFGFAPVVAQGPAAPTQLVISYSDLDLSTRAGVRQLDRRIRSAVQLACGPVSDADLVGKNDVIQCRNETLALARAQREVAIAEARQPQATQYASGR
jgi:UrcA family protein